MGNYVTDETDVREHAPMLFVEAFSGSTVPTTTQVTSEIIPEIEGEVDAAFKSIGITTPLADSDDITRIRRYVLDGCVWLAFVRSQRGLRGYTSDSLIAKYEDRYRKFITKIEKQQFALPSQATNTRKRSVTINRKRM